LEGKDAEVRRSGMDTDLAGLSLFESDDIHNFSPSIGVYKPTASGYTGFP
jgi:hypothetical protein